MKIKANPVQSLIVILLLLVLLFVWKRCSGPSSSVHGTGRSGVGLSAVNSFDRWHCSFLLLNGTRSGFVSARGDAAKLVYYSDLRKGSVTFRLYHGSEGLIYTFPPSQNVDTLKEIFQKGEVYEIRATAQNAEGEFDFRME